MSAEFIQTSIVTVFAASAAATLAWKVIAPWRMKQASGSACAKCASGAACGSAPQTRPSELIQIGGLRKRA